MPRSGKKLPKLWYDSTRHCVWTSKGVKIPMDDVLAIACVPVLALIQAY